MKTNLINAEKIKREAERKMAEALEEKQLAVEQFKNCISGDLRELEKLIGREAVKDFLKDFPLVF